MSKEQVTKKDTKKKPAKTLIEKRKEKQEKKKNNLFCPNWLPFLIASINTKPLYANFHKAKNHDRILS